MLRLGAKLRVGQAPATTDGFAIAAGTGAFLRRTSNLGNRMYYDCSRDFSLHRTLENTLGQHMNRYQPTWTLEEAFQYLLLFLK
jgi:hypothetical protein